MFQNKRNNILLSLLLCTLVFWGCPSEEYTSAKLYLQQNDLEKAEEFLVKAMAVEVDNPEIPFQLGHHIYGKDGRWTEMNEVYDKALAIDPNRKILEGSTVQEMVDISRFGYWSDVYNNAVKVYNSSKGLEAQDRKTAIRDAISEFQTASEIKADESLNYTMLATSFFELGEPDKGAEFIVKAVKIAPQDFNANMTAGQIFSRNNQPENALQYLQKAVELDPGNTAAIRNLAQTYYDLGNINESIATYQKAIRTTVDMKTKADLHFNLGVLYNQIGDFDEAEDHFISALDLNPEDVEAILGMAQTFESNEKWRKAEKFYKELIYLQPENAAYYRGIARALIQQGKQAEAQRYFDKSKKYD
ncbi:MAG TPA: tetratricopeptide repeat protein [Candidatus Marinimicrobia bacterium]|nr:tetratricopeptide repeat protein [Candidatus Neomarinimicrobiota bacterium]